MKPFDHEPEPSAAIEGDCLRYYIEEHFQVRGEEGRWLRDWDDHSDDLLEVQAALQAYETHARAGGRSPWWEGEVLWTGPFSNYRIVDSEKG